MYHIRPLADVPETIDLPKCMYNIKPMNGIHLERPGLTLAIQRVKMEPELQAIEERQLEVISRLRQLRETVDELINKAGGPRTVQHPGSNVVSKNEANNQTLKPTRGPEALAGVCLPVELVVEANPSRPPLSILFFRNLVPNLRTVSHIHSSYGQQVEPKLTSIFSHDTIAPSNSTLRVVWKNGQGSRLTPPTLGSCGVDGESNVARYLSRVLTKSDDSVLNYDALPLEDLVLVDGVLESSGLVDNAPEQFLNSLQAYVQSRRGGGISSRTIADFVGYSTLRYLTKQQPGRSFQKSLVDWMNCLTNEVPSLS